MMAGRERAESGGGGRDSGDAWEKATKYQSKGRRPGGRRALEKAHVPKDPSTGGRHYSVLTCATATATATTTYYWYRSYVDPVASENQTQTQAAVNYTGPKMSKPSPPTLPCPSSSLLNRSTVARHAHRPDWTEMAVCQSVTAGLRCLDETKSSRTDATKSNRLFPLRRR